MDYFRAFLEILDTQRVAPEPYGLFHIFCLVLTGVLTVVAACRGKRHSKKTVRRVVFLTALAVALLEVYKQINFTFGNGSTPPAYQWYAFPWQFCSTPMYIGLLTGIFRRGRVHRALCAYLATYCVFAGAAVMAYPVTVFVETVGINIQTMVCHGSMVVIGGYLLGSGYVKIELRSLLRAMPVFASCVALAAILNEAAYRCGIENFNMFFISPYVPCELPVYSLIHTVLPFPVNLMVYVLGFTLVAGVILSVAWFLARIFHPRATPALRIIR